MSNYIQEMQETFETYGTSKIEYNRAKTHNAIVNFSHPSLKGVAFNVSYIQLPALQTTPILTAFQNFEIRLPDNRLDPDTTITMTYYVDVAYANYVQLFKLMLDVRNPFTGEQADNIAEHFQDIQVILLDNNSQPIMEIVLLGCWVSALSPLSFDFQGLSTDEVTNTVTFCIQDMKMTPLTAG